MFVFLEVESNVEVGSVVSYNNSSQKWSLASDDSNLIGVVNSVPEISEDKLIAKVMSSGSTYAIADMIIPDEGGNLSVLSGKVYVDNTKDCGIISPAIINSSQRQAGELVMIHIR